jgi:hypothetical protein
MSSLRIVFPHDGDVFARSATADALQTREQQIALRAVDSGRTVRWSVAGTRLPLDAGGNAYWPLRLGTWTIDAEDGIRHDRVTIRVIPPRPASQPGFTVITRRGRT